MRISTTMGFTALLVLAAATSSAYTQTATTATPAPPPVARDLSEYRAANPTHLTRHGSPPKVWQDPRPLKLPAGVKEVTYDSDGLKLKAWLSDAPDDGKAHPAVVFCHGGFWFSNEDWGVLKPFLDAGYVVMAPRVRAENGNPGGFEYYYGEVNDVVAAGRFLAAQKGVDKTRVFVSGHSAGGELATLAVMLPNPFAMSAPIGAGLDMRVLAALTDDRHKQLVVFDANDPHEVESRCSMLFTASLRCPIALFHGDKDWGDKLQKQFVALAHHFKKDATLTVVPGDHGQSLPNAIPGIIKLFNEFQPQRAPAAGEPAAVHSDAKPLTQAQYEVRAAAMLPAFAVADYDVERSPLGEDRKKTMLEATGKLRAELTGLVKRADDHPDESATIVDEIKAKKQAAGQQLMQALTPDNQAKVGQTSQVIIYEAAIVRRLRMIRLSGPEGIERHLKAVAATEEQRAAIGKIRDELTKRQDEILDRQTTETSRLTATFTMDLWQNEAEAATRDAIRAVRKVLTPEQLVKWDASLVSNRPKSPPKPPQPTAPVPLPPQQQKPEPLPF